jgi:hypothetical protein
MASLTLWEQFQLRIQQGASDQELAVRAGLNVSELARIVPFVDVQGGAYPYALEDELPDAQPRLFDEANDDSLGTVKTEAEVLKIYGKDVKTDQSKLALFGASAHRRQLDMTIRAMRMRFERDFLNGDANASNGREMDGLRKRINTGSNQALANHDSAGPLSLSKLDELIDAVDAPPSDKVLVVGRPLGLKFNKAMRTSGVAGNIDFRPDEFGRQTLFYGDVRIIRTDVDRQNNAIQAFDEANSTCSIYCLALGEGMVSGLQGPSNTPTGQVPGLAVYDVGEMFTTPTFLTRISWHIGAVIETKRAAARLYNITNADIIA